MCRDSYFLRIVHSHTHTYVRTYFTRKIESIPCVRTFIRLTVNVHIRNGMIPLFRLIITVEVARAYPHYLYVRTYTYVYVRKL